MVPHVLANETGRYSSTPTYKTSEKEKKMLRTGNANLEELQSEDPRQRLTPGRTL